MAQADGERRLHMAQADGGIPAAVWRRLTENAGCIWRRLTENAGCIWRRLMEEYRSQYGAG